MLVILSLYFIFPRISSRRDRGELCVITKFCVFQMLFLAFMMRKSRKEELGFLITHGSLRPRTKGSMRLCVRKFK